MSPSPSDQDESLAALGQAVRRLRKEKGMTQEELAQRADLPQTVIARIEAGRREPNWGTVRRISYALDLPLPELIREVEALEAEG
jgi:transcriptional regulator with XRE-family HTH domain